MRYLKNFFDLKSLGKNLLLFNKYKKVKEIKYELKENE